MSACVQTWPFFFFLNQDTCHTGQSQPQWTYRGLFWSQRVGTTRRELGMDGLQWLLRMPWKSKLSRKKPQRPGAADAGRCTPSKLRSTGRCSKQADIDNESIRPRHQAKRSTSRCCGKSAPRQTHSLLKSVWCKVSLCWLPWAAFWSQ